MSAGRRSLLKVLAAAAPLGWTLQARAADAPTHMVDEPITDLPHRLLPLVGGGALDAAFLDGVAQAAQASGGLRERTARLPALDAVTLAHLASRLDGNTPRLVVALLDDAGAALALELLRARGARLLAFESQRLAPTLAGAAHARALGLALASGAPLPTSPATAAGAPCIALACLI
ncbi:hypothetical protein [Azohydromonas lata]|uniref:hypothetical protein n=1 Tax=Azohydromonas lata TaxID=45677 RepID=UPI00082A47B4|nr:hypothetical protein [Azohydromonas lata]